MDLSRSRSRFLSISILSLSLSLSFYISVSSCCVTNHPKIKWLKALTIIFHASIGWLGSANLGWACSCFCDQLLHWLGVGWCRMA
ncbi:unnamed protein product, partial [Gulo gulo]